MRGYIVTEEIRDAHPKNIGYPLLPGDLLTPQGERFGVYMKEAPGVVVMGFRLTPEQVATLKPVEFKRNGLDYWVNPKEIR
jgi:hypothetical protein